MAVSSAFIKGVSADDAGRAAERAMLKIRFYESQRKDGCTAVFSVSSISQNEIVNSAKRVANLLRIL